VTGIDSLFEEAGNEAFVKIAIASDKLPLRQVRSEVVSVSVLFSLGPRCSSQRLPGHWCRFNSQCYQILDIEVMQMEFTASARHVKWFNYQNSQIAG